MNNKSNISVTPNKKRLLGLLEDVAKGEIKIPVFQRDFVWNTKDMVDLFDSIFKGYPIGSLLLWQPETKFKVKDEFGPYNIIERKSNVNYVLDGFQRISTLFGVLTNPNNYEKDENSKELRKYQIYYNLENDEVTSLRSKKNKDSFVISLYKIADSFELLDVLDEIKQKNKDKYVEYHNKAKLLNKILLEYEIPYIEIKGGDIKSAVEIFSRVNSKGEDINTSYMLSALSYNPETGFILSDSITEFTNSLAKYNFENLKSDIVLNCIASAACNKIYFDVNIEEIADEKSSSYIDLEKIVDKCYVHVKAAVDFLYNNMYILDIRLLPYPMQLIFISEFFRINPNPTIQEINKLEKWFWYTTYTNYFTMYSLSLQRQAYYTFVNFAKASHIDGIYKIDDNSEFSTASFPTKINFGSVRSKALMLFYLKNIMDSAEIQDKENIIALTLSSSAKVDKHPANVIFRLSSDYEQNSSSNKILSNYIKNISQEILHKHFIEEDFRELFDLKDSVKMSQFIQLRENEIKNRERVFVESLGINYSEEE